MLTFEPRFTSLLCPLGAALLLFGLAACGGSVTTSDNTGGSGGTGNTGGTTSTGGTGGTGGEGGTTNATCTDDIKSAAYDPVPPLGFDSWPSMPMTAVVQDVTPTSLSYLLGPGGSTETFHWAGPALSDSFQAGDTVTVGVTDGWQYVAKDVIAAVYNENNFVPPDSLPPVPMTKAPVLGYASQCSFPEAGGACGQPPAAVHVLAVTAGAEPDSIAVEVGATETLGPYTIHNAQSAALPGYGGEDCILEAWFYSGVSVLGPVGK